MREFMALIQEMGQPHGVNIPFARMRTIVLYEDCTTSESTVFFYRHHIKQAIRNDQCGLHWLHLKPVHIVSMLQMCSFSKRR